MFFGNRNPPTIDVAKANLEQVEKSTTKMLSELVQQRTEKYKQLNTAVLEEVEKINQEILQLEAEIDALSGSLYKMRFILNS
jgi:predicted  nucleic acid-binding Zn-ribbon protein